MAARHLADVKIRDTWNGRQVLFRASDHFIRSTGFGGIGPEDDDMRKHCAIYQGFPILVQWPTAAIPRLDDFALDRPRCYWGRLANPSRIHLLALVLCLASAVVRRRPSLGPSMMYDSGHRSHRCRRN